MRRSTSTLRDNDVYVPGHGDQCFSVERYDLELAVGLETNRLTARALITVEMAERTDRLEFDLHALRVRKVRVDGSAPQRFTQRGSRLAIRLASPAEPGQRLLVDIAYGGSPRPMPGLDGEAGWEELTDGLLVASQPHGAPSWFPCNDRPDDKARYRFRVTAPQGYTAIANGALRSRTRRSGGVTWEYVAEEPMATYLATLQVGRYVVVDHAPAAPRPVRSWCPPERAESVARHFGQQPAMIECLERAFGPYPFDAYHAVIVDDVLEIPLEAQTLSTFGINHIDANWEAQRLIVHELSHQWFGNSLTLRHWRDIWLHEGFACYSEWLWSEACGLATVDERAAHHHRRLQQSPQDLLLIDPGPDDMFDDRVYKRGALTLHATRRALGDDAFFTLLRTWVQRHRHGTVDYPLLREAVVAVGGDAVADLLTRWVEQRDLPDLPA